MLSRATATRRLATDPLAPLLSLTALGVLAALGAALGVAAEPVAPALIWAVLGGLAGYTLSGSV